MADDECWAIRAQAEELRSEVSMLRGVVAALRARASTSSNGVARPAWHLHLAAFGLGVALTMLAALACRAVLCP